MSIQWPEPEHSKESAGATCEPATTLGGWFAAGREPAAVREDAELEADA